MTLLPARHWAYSFSIGAEDIDSITYLLLEKELPLSSVELATAIIKQREQNIKRQLERQFEGTKVYQPSGNFALGDRLTFAQMNYRTATVVALRDGKQNNTVPFKVATVAFDDAPRTSESQPREFATEYDGEHPLNQPGNNHHPGHAHNETSAEAIAKAPGVTIMQQVNDALEKNPDLVRIAGTWFVRELLQEVNIGHLNLAEAALDIHDGGPLGPEEILDQIGALGDAPMPLQVFSLNYAMNQDDRFDEVGPAGVILWHLKRLLPREVQEIPTILHYLPVKYDRSLLTKGMRQLEYDLDDEHSPIKSPPPDEDVSITLTYPHRRVGTLPINSETKHVFPDAKTPRIAITIVDALDKEEYPCWVVHEFKFVYGLSELYKKHRLPVGAYVYLNRSSDPSRFEIEFDEFRSRTEWIPVVETTGKDQFRIITSKRAIGVDFDEMIIVGFKVLKEVDSLGLNVQNDQVPIAKLLRKLISDLSKQNPQGSVHGKVLYSTINILRRCPPGPIFATLVANPDFEHVGDNYWKLSQ